MTNRPTSGGSGSDLAGKVAVVTGGAGGIGRGIARALAHNGAHSILADVDGPSVEATAAELLDLGVTSLGTACDVTDRRSVEALADLAWNRFGRVDMIFNNAGIIGDRTDCLDIDEAAARAILDVNLMGVWHGCAVFGQRFLDQATPAHIVNTASENGVAAPVTRRAFYTASKHAVVGLSDVLRQELPAHITVSVLCPGIVASKMTGMDGNTAPPIGLSADDVGHHTLAAMQTGAFYIVTHPPVADYVAERAQELQTAFDNQAPRFDGDQRLDTRALARSPAAGR